MNLNKVTLIGNLTRDPVSRKLPSGQTVTHFGLATNRTWKDIKTKERKESVEYHNLLAWSRLAEIVASYLKKGEKVYVEGRLQTRHWQDKEGLKRSRTEIVVDNLIMMGRSSAVKEKVGKETQKQLAPEEVNVEDVEVVEAN